MMATTLSLRAANLEPVYGWLEQHGEAPVEVWGQEHGRRAALLAYSEGPPDGFCWSNWVSAAYRDPSEVMALFPDVEIALVSDAEAASLKGAFPQLLANAPS
jgi:hypothetical protein